MATIGLKVQDSPLGGNLSLADTLAKGIFGDPEAEMKAKLYAAQIGNYGANTDFTRAKTKAEIDSENAILAAGPAIGAAAAAAIPDPVPVKTPRPTDSTGYGPQLAPVEVGAVNPAEQARIDALRAQERVLGPILARGNPDQVAKGVNTNYGGAVLSGALGNPAVVNPNMLRIAGALYTGSAPTTSTVWSPGDTAGVDAAAREKILEARGAPQKPEFREINHGLVVPTLQPDGTYKAVPVAGAEPQAATPDAPKIIMVDKTPYLEGPDGTLKPAPGYSASVDASGPYGGLNSEAGINNKIVNDLAKKLAAGQPLSDDEKRLYAQAYNGLFGGKVQITKDEQGNDRPVIIRPEPPPGFPGLGDPRVALGLAPPGPGAPPAPPAGPPAAGGAPAAPPLAGQPLVAVPPAAPPAPPAAPAPGGGLATPLPPLFPPKPPAAPNEAQAKQRIFAPMLVNATATLDKFNAQNLPENWETWLTSPSDEPGVLGRLAEQFGTSDNAKRYGAAASLWLSNQLYDLSGAAINRSEFDRGMRGYLPRPGEPQDLIDQKTQLRHDFINALTQGAFGNDTAARDKFVADAVAKGVQLNTPAAPAAAPGGQPTGGGAKPPRRRTYDAQGNLQ